MRLILEEYLRNIKERNELDAILPELLSEMGMDVFSKPQIGVDQKGVDVAALGKVCDLSDDNNDQTPCVYLFTIKPGNLSREDWSRYGKQELIPSLRQIKDEYINFNLGEEYKDHLIKVCICIGGTIDQNVAQSITGFETTYNTEKIELIRCGGGKLANLINKYFLSENILPDEYRKDFRKSLAFADDPSISKDYFIRTIRHIFSDKPKNNKQLLSQLRKVFIAHQVHLIWCEEANNLEASYVASEACLLLAWNASKSIMTKTGRPGSIQQKIIETFFSLYSSYDRVASKYCEKISGLACEKYALSAAINSPEKLDISLALFEVLGRIAMIGQSAHYSLIRASQSENEETKRQVIQFYSQRLHDSANCIKEMINNNPILLSPVKDNHAIDILLTANILIVTGDIKSLNNWLLQMIDRVESEYVNNGLYPSVYNEYFDLTVLNENKDDQFRSDATTSSVLYPLIALIADRYDLSDLKQRLRKFIKEQLPHCDMQFWIFSGDSEDNMYEYLEEHGNTVSGMDIFVKEPSLSKIFDDEVDNENINYLTCIQRGLYELTLISARHYRNFMPIELLMRPDNTEE